MRLHRLSVGRTDSVLCWLRFILASFHLCSVVFLETVYLNLDISETGKVVSAFQNMGPRMLQPSAHTCCFDQSNQQNMGLLTFQ